MEIKQLRCFLAVAEALHFGRAAQKLGILPASLGREIRLLEEALGARIIERTTRHVLLTDEGRRLLDDARQIVSHVDAVQSRFQQVRQGQRTEVRIGAIDSAAAGLIPQLLHDLKLSDPDVSVRLLEEKTVKLLPRLQSGRLDLAFIRPPETVDPRIKLQRLFNETVVVAMAASHRLADREHIDIEELENEPLIVPDRRSRPHSHDLTIKLFTDAGMHVRIAQVADEKQTIVNLVAADIGLAIVPRWTSRLSVSGVRYLPLKIKTDGAMTQLPLSAAWVKGVRDPLRDRVVALLMRNLDAYARNA